MLTKAALKIKDNDLEVEFCKGINLFIGQYGNALEQLASPIMRQAPGMDYARHANFVWVQYPDGTVQRVITDDIICGLYQGGKGQTRGMGNS